MRKKKKLIIIIVASVLVIGIVGTFVGLHIYNNRFIYNKKDAVGNTTGNLYNGGMFCVYDGYVYFSNPDDKGKLYRMKEDGSELEKIHDDSVSGLNISNGYIYYVKDNMAGDIAFISPEMSNGINRLKIGQKKTETLHQGVSDALLMYGNNLYYRAYNENTGAYYIRKASTDGKSDESLLEDPCLLLDAANDKIFYANTVGNHNLMYYDPDENQSRIAYAGNFYMPDFAKDYIYYIDLDNNHKITRLGYFTLETEVLSDDYAVKFNVNEATGDIYYQCENTDKSHALKKMKMDGSGQGVVSKGSYTNINFTEEYVYFYSVESGSAELYRSKLPGGVPEVYHPGKKKNRN